MIKYHYLFGGVLSTLIAGTAIPASVSATDTPSTPAVTVARPTIEQLQAAVTKLESVGSYRTYFIDETATLDASDPFYAEYRYLNELTRVINFFIETYDRQPDIFLQDAILASEDAVRGCNLLFNGTANKTVVNANIISKLTATPSATTGKSQAPVSNTPATQTPVSTANTQANTTAKANAGTQTSNIAKASEVTTTAAAPSETPAATAAPTTSEVAKDQATTENAENESDIPVPATGEATESTETKSPIPLFAAIIAGAAAVSVIIAAILHRQPKSRF